MAGRGTSLTFMTMPADIRIIIYQYLMEIPGRVELSELFRRKYRWTLPPLQVCSEFRQEGVKALLRRNVFEFEMLDPYTSEEDDRFKELLVTGWLSRRGFGDKIFSIDFELPKTKVPPQKAFLPLGYPEHLLEWRYFRHLSISFQPGQSYVGLNPNLIMKVLFKTLAQLTEFYFVDVRCIEVTIRRSAASSAINMERQWYKNRQDRPKGFSEGKGQVWRKRLIASLPTQISKWHVKADELHFTDIHEDVLVAVQQSAKVYRRASPSGSSNIRRTPSWSRLSYNPQDPYNFDEMGISEHEWRDGFLGGHVHFR